MKQTGGRRRPPIPVLIMMVIIFFITLAFVAIILFLRRGLYRLDQPLPPGDGNVQRLTFSVVIAARNEERNISDCLRSIFMQDIPPGRYEVIVVDDRSGDSTPGILYRLSKQHRNLQVITIAETPPGVSPKKHAVMRGIAAASNEVIAFTDADCRVPPCWLATINRYLDGDTALVQGISAHKYIYGMNKLFYGLQAVDFLSHGVISAAAIGANLPINSNANNMAFRKPVFDAVGGYGDDNRVTLGDDDHLLQRVWATGKKVRYMADPGCIVETMPAPTVRELFEQRRRWGSVTVHYNARQVALLSAVFAFYVSIALTAVMSIFDFMYLPVFLSLLLVKLAGELTLMAPGARIFGRKNLLKYVHVASLLQLPLVLAAVVSGVFGKFEWKGRRMARTAG